MWTLEPTMTEEDKAVAVLRGQVIPSIVVDMTSIALNDNTLTVTGIDSVNFSVIPFVYKKTACLYGIDAFFKLQYKGLLKNHDEFTFSIEFDILEVKGLNEFT